MDDKEIYEICEQNLYKMILLGVPEATFFYLDKMKWKGFKEKRYFNLLKEIESRKQP